MQEEVGSIVKAMPFSRKKEAGLRHMIFILTGQTQVFQLTYKTFLEGHHCLQYKTKKFKAKKRLTPQFSIEA